MSNIARAGCKRWRAGPVAGLLCLVLTAPLVADEQAVEQQGKPGDYKIENEQFTFRLIPRTPEQMAAFYEARGFSESARNLLADTCFITAGFRNKSDKIIWLELSNWRFESSQGVIHRLDRPYWEAQWDLVKLPQASRSTFGWTLLPESRDLQPGEPVGGNIVLPPQDAPFTLKAYFVTGRNKRGSGIELTFNNIQCMHDN